MTQRNFSAIEVNTWVHIALVRNIVENKIYFYKNGVELQSTSLGYIPTPVTNHTLEIGYSYTGYLLGNLNDVRFYDHALSEKEIQELVKAKVLHYTFNELQEPTTNLVDTSVNVTYGTGTYTLTSPTTPDGWYVAHGTRTSSNHYIFRLDLDVIPDGETRTFSIEHVSYSGNVIPHLTGSNGIGDMTYVGNNKWERTWTNNLGANKSEGIYWDYTPAQDTAIDEYWYYRYYQVEAKDHATPYVLGSRTGEVLDASGFRNDAPLDQPDYSPEWQESSGLGTGSYKFSTDRILLNNGLKLTDTVTLAAWIKLDTIRESGLIQTDFYLSIDSTGHLRTYWYDTSSAGYHVSPNVLPQGEWVHVAAVWNGTQAILYENGSAVYTANSTTPGRHSTTYIAFGLEGNNYPPTTTRILDGSMGDVRIYGNALSATDILELSQTRAQLDNTGNLHVNEVSESSSILLVESQQKNANTSIVFGTLTILNPDLTSFLESDDTLGNFRVEGWVYVSDTVYVPTRFEYTYENNTKGFYMTTILPISGSWVLGWNKILIDSTSFTYADAANTPWYNMTRLEIYKSGPTTGADTSQYVIFKDLKLVKNLDNSVIQGSLSDGGTYNASEVSEIGIADGLVNYWKLNGDAKDYSGNGDNGVDGNYTFESFIKDLGGRITTTQYISLSNSISPPVTMTCWLKPLVNSDDVDGTVFGLYQDGTNSVQFGFYGTSNAPYLDANGYVSKHLHVAYNFLANTCYFLSLTVSATNATITAYYNGAVVQTWSWDADYTSYNFASVRLDIGGTNVTYRDVRIYDRVLTADEINILCKYGLPTTGMQLSENGTLYTNKEIIEAL